MARCPKCGATRPQGASECPECGIIYARAEQLAAKKAAEEQLKTVTAEQEGRAQKVQPSATSTKLTNCPACNRQVSVKATSCPHCGEPLTTGSAQTEVKSETGKKTSPATIGCGIIILILGALALFGHNNTPGIGNHTASSPPPASRPDLSVIELELLSMTWHSEHGFAIMEGEVKNISSNKLDGVQAIGSWYNASGTLITSDSAIIEYNPIMPGQTSPFKVMATYNPEMKTASIRFKHIFGRSISFKRTGDE